MPRVRVDRDRFVARIDTRMRWAYRYARARRQVGLGRKSFQATVYDATFRSDAEAVTYHYALFNDHLPDFDAPVWLNEKIRWQFLHHPNPLMSVAADKLGVRGYLDWIGAEVPAPRLIASGTAPDDILHLDLPDRFVLKSTYGSGQVHVETGPVATDRLTLRDTIAHWETFDQWRHTGEMHYRNLPKRWLVEEYVPAERRALEYKVFCSNGEPVFVMVIAGRSADGTYARTFYDLNWRPLGITTRGRPVECVDIPRPDDLDLILAEASRLARHFLHVRVDFLQRDSRLVFSELTFASLAARLPYQPVEVNRLLGDTVDLSLSAGLLARGREVVAELLRGGNAPLASGIRVPEPLVSLCDPSVAFLDGVQGAKAA